jgi:formylglycine-generating enzyme required for sulfatase activity
MNAPDPAVSLDPLAALELATALALEEGPRTPDPAPDGLDLTPQVAQVKECLRLLHQVWPRAADAPPAPDTGGRYPTRPDAAWDEAFERPFRLPGFQILNEIGRGGMGILYRARQLNLNREVALKRLPPAYVADPERLQRFHTEAAAVARLQDFGVLPVYDILHAAGTPVLVLPFIDGRDLGRVITERRALRDGQEVAEPHSLATADDRTYLARVLPILDRLIDAVAATHAVDILHRDIKPANVLLDAKDNAWLCDFGLARLRDNPRLTKAGEWMGTPGFISPEQWTGQEDLDARADVFSLAATIYQALTLQLPYGNTRLSADSGPPLRLRRLQPLLSADFEYVLLKALEPDREDRYQSVAEFKADWRRVRQGLPPKGRRLEQARRFVRQARRNPWKVASCVLAAVLLGIFGFFPRQPAPEPPDPTVYRTVQITTNPPGARVVLVPFNQYQDLDPDHRIKPPEGQVTPLTLERVPVGKYLVVAEIPDYGFHEVYRIVPEPGPQAEVSAGEQSLAKAKDGVVEVDAIRIYPSAEAQKGMALFCGGKLILNDESFVDKRTFERQIDPFYLDPTEVTVGAYKKVWLGALPPRMHGGSLQSPPDFDDYALHSVTFFEALHYAESVGKRLPTQFEYEFAATKGGTQRFPWGDEEKAGNWAFGPVKHPEYDHTDTNPPVYGLYSNVAEWTDSLDWNYDPAYHPSVKKYPADYLASLYHSRVVRGAPSFIIWGKPPQKGDEITLRLGPRWHQRHRCDMSFATVGFRCARSARPRFLD